MNVTPWLAPDSLADELARIAVEANDAGAAVIVPALEVDYDTGFAASSRMASAVAAVLTTAAITRAWQRAGDQSTKGARAHWVREARAAGILDRVGDPNLSDREMARWRRENEARFVLIRDQVKRQTDAHMKRQQAARVGAAVVAADLLIHGLPTHNGRLAGRGRVIASDQLDTLGGLIAAHQQQDAGVKGFIWRTREDQRVRDSHDALLGRQFAWDAPPSVGLPGQPIRCRCWAEGIVIR